MSENVVEAVGVSKHFRDFWGRVKVHAVEDIKLEVPKGKILGLLGPNGSGKSTTIKMILGFLKPTAGHISVFGQLPSSSSNKSKIGYLPEESYFYPFLTAEETLHFFGGLHDLNKAHRKDRSKQLLEMVGLSQVRDRKVGEFSKGMARRIGLAQALVGDPELLILDEPTTGLDPIGIVEMKELILDLKSKGKTIIVSSHLLADMQDICDTISVMYGGKIIASGALSELLANQQKYQIDLEDISKDKKVKLEEYLKEQSISFKLFRPRKNLEEFFMNVIGEVAREDTSGSTAGKGTPQFITKSTEEVLSNLTKKDETPESEKADKEVLENLTNEEPENTEDKPDQDLLSKLTQNNKNSDSK